MVLIPKEDASYRFCMDYHKLNSITKKDVYPVPLNWSHIGHPGRSYIFLHTRPCFGVLADWNGIRVCCQVCLHHSQGTPQIFENAIWNVQYSSHFQWLMEVILIWRRCFMMSLSAFRILGIISNIWIKFSSNYKMLFNGWTNKCVFLQDEVPYLRHVMSCDGIRWFS